MKKRAGGERKVRTGKKWKGEEERRGDGRRDETRRDGTKQERQDKAIEGKGWKGTRRVSKGSEGMNEALVRLTFIEFLPLTLGVAFHAHLCPLAHPLSSPSSALTQIYSILDVQIHRGQSAVKGLVRLKFIRLIYKNII